MTAVDPAFLALPFDAIADAALQAARDAGASYADVRVERRRTRSVSTRDEHLQSFTDAETSGFGVRVIAGGGWGYASSHALTPGAAAAAAARAVELARALSPLNSDPVELAPEPVHTGTWASPCTTNPFDVEPADQIAFLLGLNERARATGKAAHADSTFQAVLEGKFFATLEGTRTIQQRIRVNADINAVRVDPETGAFERMSSASPPYGGGWEWCTDGYDFAGAADQIPELLEEKLASPSVQPGAYDLVLDPGNLWLTIHESIGHSTELDRALGYEANYAGTSFATLDKLGSFRVGSEAMNVTGDRTAEHGLSTVAWDDEGVAAQTWDIIRDGVLVGYQLNRQMAHRQGFGRSNGCAYADHPAHVPMQRMPNVSLRPAATEVTLDDLIGGVEDGIYIVGNNSWSIDMQRYNFQFTGQRFHRIRGGKLDGQLRDVAYQSSTPRFWNALEAVGGPSTYVLGGSFNCGKGQPGQVAPVSHGCPPALFRGIGVLNTAQEGTS